MPNNTLDEFQAKCMKTEIYSSPSISQGIPTWVYPALNLSGEAGEVAGKLSKIIRDQHGIISVEDEQLIAKEIFDVMWCCAALAYELGMTLDQIADIGLAKLKKRQEEGKLGGSGDTR